MMLILNVMPARPSCPILAKRVRRACWQRVLLVGAGGLGSPAGFYLAAAGIGHVTIIDDEQVETSNLNRQILHTTASVGMPKVAQAVQAMKALNPAMQVRPVQARLAADNVDALVTEHDLVVDCTDNAQTRFLLGGQRIGCGDRWSLAVPCVPKARLLCFKVVLRALNTPLLLLCVSRCARCQPCAQMLGSRYSGAGNRRDWQLSGA